MNEPPTHGGPPQESAAAIRLATEDVPCLRCGYNLRGLKPDGICPECGASIKRSLRGNLLVFSAPEYVARLHTGLMCILLAVLLLVLGGLTLGIAETLVRDFLPDQLWIAMTISNTATVGGLALSILSVVGWWLFSEPDEAILGYNTGDTPRKVLRVTVVISAAVLAIDTAGEFGMYRYVAHHAIHDARSIISPLAWIVSFFASLLYVRWLARRLPNPQIVNRANSYLWALPLIFILGACVLMIGPLIATIMYLLLLHDVRAHIRKIMRAERTMEATGGA